MKAAMVLAMVVSVVFGASRPEAATPVIFDNDMAIDDWSALLFLQRHPQVELRALTIAGSGEAHCEPGMANALALLELAAPGSDVPVACGDPWPLDGYFVFPVPWQEDMDRLSGVSVPPARRKPYQGHAVELIHRTVRDAEKPVVILATGPMTNLAQWLRRYPEDREKVSRIVIMGGTLDTPGNIVVPGFTDDHPNERAEWNFFVDPVAADILLRSGLAVEMVGLDVTNTVRVTERFAARFKRAADNPAARFWDRVLERNDWFIASGEYYFWDVLAAEVVVDRERFCRGRWRSLKVRHPTAQTPWMPTSDTTMPGSNWQGEPRRHLNAATAGAVVPAAGEAGVLVCRETDAEAAFELFIDTLTGEAPSH